MSGFEMKCSGVLSGPDIADNPGVRGLLNIPLEFGREKLE
jgi:hypothetical protein